jgi:hypothetical protein
MGFVARDKRSRLCGVSLDEPLLLERAQVALHGAARGKADSLADLADRRRITVFATKISNDIEDGLLARRRLAIHCDYRLYPMFIAITNLRVTMLYGGRKLDRRALSIVP